MKSSAPWSVKGIERDARETAKEAAKREGMTVGEWINQMIYSAGEAESSGGEVEGLKLRDIVTAIELLHKRVAESQSEGAGAVAEMTRKIGDVVERVQRLERIKPAEGAHHDLAERLERLEQNSDERERIDALKALEKAVAQVAVQFNNAQKASGQRLDAVERQLQQFAARIDKLGAGSAEDAGAGHLKNAIDGLSARIARAERIAGEAAKLKSEAGASADPAFVESTGNRLRVLGDEIKRGGDQIRALESTLGKLSSQIDAAERRSAEGVQKVAETLADMREKFASDAAGDASRADIDAAVAEATRETEERISALRRSFDEIIKRLDALGGDAGAAKAAPARAAGRKEKEVSVAEGGAARADDFEAIEADEPAPADAAAEPEPPAPEARAGDETSADEEDEDPFAFAEEIEAALEEATDDSGDDDFRFELDDGKEDRTAADEESGSEAQRLLSEVKAAFGKGAPSRDAPKSNDEDDDAKRSEDDLDAILADLDELTSTEKSAEEAEPGEDEDDPAKAAAEEAPETSKAEQSKEDYLKAARRHAIQSAQRTVQETRPSRRTLTAKQKAILAARARRKRLAEKAGEQQPSDPQKLQIAKEALRDRSADETEAEEEEQGRFARATAAAASIRDRLPFVGKKAEAEKPAEAPSEADARHGDRAAMQTLRSAISARPVTLALTVGIFLSIAALFYLIKDLVFTPAPREETRAQAVAPEPAAEQAAEEAPEVAAPDPETASAPAIDPRELYFDAMAVLNAAGGEGDASEAVETLREAAALGHPPAQLQLGELYKLGQGVDQDLGQARTWFRRSANGGNILAMHRIGVMTARGDGGPADTAEAIAWFERAAKHGLVDSQYNLGAIYHPTDNPGASTVQDVGKAYYWYSLAAKNGDDQAGPLADSVAPGLSAEEKGDLDQAVADWEALPADEAANELAPTNG